MSARYSGAAEQDFIEIGAHIARDDLAVALRFQSELEAFIERVGAQPTIYRLRSEWGQGIRAARQGSYFVIFTTEDDGILVLRIVNGKRNIATLLREADA